MEKISRREATRLIGGAAAAASILPMTSRAAGNASSAQLLRAIPSTGEKVPAVGLGTSQTFDVGNSPNERDPLREVLRRFVELGGKVVDTSPMYGRAEEVIGDLTNELKLRDSLFLASKVWTTGKQEGTDSIERTFRLLQTKRLDLMQVHNLVDLETQLATLRAWKADGRIRYVGITHYVESSFPEVEKILRREKLDFLQINYSIAERAAEERILPLAREKGVAVLVNRPFARGDLFSKLRARPLPDWAAEFDCKSWAQFLLKWILANAAVTCAIPATSNARHLEDNMAAGTGRLPDEKTRERMVQLIRSV
ncbi:MAG TPA: aldo/keto reductase [Chthoniobacterales bacterium]|jgi:aryl-alcohol dehydrogenase-like predicted oxidoreductase